MLRMRRRSPRQLRFRLRTNLECIVIVTVNGEPKELPQGATVRTLIECLGLHTRACAAEVNERLIPKQQHEQHTLAPDDRIEIVTLVGGG